jgi:hypothetical protein
MFGSEDKYFVHSLIEDTSKFAQRGYAKLFADNKVSSVLEGPEIKSALYIAR